MIGGASLDVTKCFYQQPIEPIDKWKPAFSTVQRGHEQLAVAAMGLPVSPWFFQGCMDTLLSYFPWSFVLVYIDDIII